MSAPPVLLVPEIRDDRRINAAVVRLLDSGHPVIRLAEVAGQRLLLAGLRGPWRGQVVIEGTAGPELAAGMDAPLTVICRGGAGPAAGRGLVRGDLAILGSAGDLVGTMARGGRIRVDGPSGARAGLLLGGSATLVLAGPWGPLLGERLQGGQIIVGHPPEPAGRDRLHAGFGLQAGSLYFHQTAPPAWLDRHLQVTPGGSVVPPAVMAGLSGWPDLPPPMDCPGPWCRATARAKMG